mgnify:CR=1 FL=1
MSRQTRQERRRRRHLRVRRKVFGTPERPRLSVYRSLKHMYAQVVDDTRGHTLVFVSTLDPALRETLQQSDGGKVEAARKVGLELARRALDKGVTRVVFDRGGFLYHGRVAAVAEGAREGGLQF